MNERDCNYFASPHTGVAKLFSDAHESNTPSHLSLEKQMDVFNNAVGQTVGHNRVSFTPTAISLQTS
jgi:hypothetical protein